MVDEAALSFATQHVIFRKFSGRWKEQKGLIGTGVLQIKYSVVIFIVNILNVVENLYRYDLDRK